MPHRLGDERKRCTVVHQGRGERMPGGLGGQSRNAQLLTDTLQVLIRGLSELLDDLRLPLGRHSNL